jgi:hypothetical protein
MEREELLQNVQNEIEADGKKLSRSISEETINAELDDELENIGDDEEANKKVYARIAKRLLRIDGNIHSNVSREVSDYKKKVGKQGSGGKSPKDGEGGKEGDDDETPKWAKALSDRLDAIEKSRKDAATKAEKDSAEAAVKKDLRAKFKDANVEVNEYILRQTLRDLEIPEVEDGERIDTDSLVAKMERAYYRNLKEAGLDKKDTSQPRFGGKGGDKGGTAADRFFAKKGKKEGWGKKD